MEFKKSLKAISVKEAIKKMAAFCAYQERSQEEVRQKMYKEYSLDEEAVEFVIAELIGQNFINEERFAKTFASSKFRLKKWGKIKIKQALRQHHLSEYCLRQALAEIPDEAYEETLRILLEKKNKQIKDANLLKRKQKLLQYVSTKGYEMDISIELIRELLS
ncbi:MAG: regulatory protein RecX [Thermonemataceae bacterium]|nr:regulatory protein RecX [Thermonemataceae bacterium]